MSLSVDGQDLYAVALAWLRPNGQEYKGEIHHVHADSPTQAEIHFKTLYPNRRKVRVIGASLCVGMKVYDRKGRALVAETSALDFRKGESEREQEEQYNWEQAHKTG